MAATRTRSTAEERRAQVVEAAVREFAVGGLEGATTQAIAARAGISQAYVFRLYGSKKELFLAVVEHGFDRVAEAFRAAVADVADPSPAARFTAMGDAYRRLLQDRDLLLVQLQAYAASSDADVRDTVRRCYADLWQLVTRLSGARPEQVYGFFATGMLLNVAAAVDLPDLVDPTSCARWCAACDDAS